MAVPEIDSRAESKKSVDNASKKKKRSKSSNKTESVEDAATEVQSPATRHRKRKRDVLPDGEIEIDINLPEPPSKKALRRAKKGKPASSTTAPLKQSLSEDDEELEAPQGNPNFERSKFGVWVGNLPWTATKDTLRAFITERTTITDDQITRINMPPPSKDTRPQQALKPQNKGFAYVDFSTQEALDVAIALSETLMGGRRLLIKNESNFMGRPEKDAVDSLLPKGGKPPNNRIFVGNLSFDVTKDDLTQHYAQCGEVLDVHMATFEDSGKCKGYAWVTFQDLEVAKTAVIGYIYKSRDGDQSDDESEASEADTKATPAKKQKKKPKQKWYVNQLYGRPLRVEFAEDAQTRYKKRYGKDSGNRAENQTHAEGEEGGTKNYTNGKLGGKRSRSEESYRKVDARNIAPGAAHTNAERASYAIVEAKGKKTTFD